MPLGASRGVAVSIEIIEVALENIWGVRLIIIVLLRYISPDKYYENGSPQEIWDNMGRDILCQVFDDLTTQIILPPGKDNSYINRYLPR